MGFKKNTIFVFPNIWFDVKPIVAIQPVPKCIPEKLNYVESFDGFKTYNKEEQVETVGKIKSPFWK